MSMPSWRTIPVCRPQPIIAAQSTAKRTSRGCRRWSTSTLAAADVCPKSCAQRFFDPRVGGRDFVFGQGVIVGAIAQRERQALAPRWNRVATVDIEQLHALQQVTGHVPNGQLDVGVGRDLVKDDGYVTIRRRKARWSVDR